MVRAALGGRGREMTVELGIALVCCPLVAIVAVAYAIRETPVRSEESATFEQHPTPLWAMLVVALVAGALFAAGSQSRASAFYLLIVVLSLGGAGFVERKLLVTVAEITYSYVNPAAWSDGEHPPGPRWRYQMKARFINDPEYVDGIVLEMVKQHHSYAELEDALTRDDFPGRYDQVLDSKLWGPAFPTVRLIVKRLVMTQVFNNDGPFKSGKTADEIFAELRRLSEGDPRTLLDRWQYYWCLRNLNLVDSILKRVRGPLTLIGTILVGAVVFCVSVMLFSGGSLSVTLLLRGVAGGALFWLLVVCGGASILIVGVFRGTGTFSIARPTRGTDFDPLWTHVIQVGILAFAVSFLVYGIGSPFLLQPAALDRFVVNGEFLAYAAGSFLFCLIVFAVHTVGVHNLMRSSRDNALDRASEDLSRADSRYDEAELDHFRDVRGMRVWPLRSSTVLQLAGGILLPVGAQAILIYSGLR
jgi:hypothetical protein